MSCLVLTRVKARRVGSTIAAIALCFCGMVVVLAASATSAVVATSAANTANPIRGKELFEKRCTGCHSLDADKEGPRLRGVYGRKVGSIPSFKYSDGMKAGGFIWDEAALNRWLIDTESVVPDNDMDFHVPKDDERADIIAYLRVSSGK